MSTELPTIDTIIQRLKPYNLTAVARETGIPRHTLDRLCSGETVPPYDTIKRLLEWMDDNAK